MTHDPKRSYELRATGYEPDSTPETRIPARPSSTFPGIRIQCLRRWPVGAASAHASTRFTTGGCISISICVAAWPMMAPARPRLRRLVASLSRCTRGSRRAVCVSVSPLGRRRVSAALFSQPHADRRWCVLALVATSKQSIRPQDRQPAVHRRRQHATRSASALPMRGHARSWGVVSCHRPTASHCDRASA